MNYIKLDKEQYDQVKNAQFFSIIKDDALMMFRQLKEDYRVVLVERTSAILVGELIGRREDEPMKYVIYHPLEAGKAHQK